MVASPLQPPWSASAPVSIPVSTPWLAIARQEQLVFKPIHVEARDRSEELVQALRHANLTSITLKDRDVTGDAVSAGVLRALASGCPQLAFLDLDRPFLSHYSPLENLFRSLTGLKCLVLESCFVLPESVSCL